MKGEGLMISDTKDLISLARDLASDDLDLLDYLDHLERQFQERESVVKAFLPEEYRFTRLHQEAEALIERYPHPKERPPLFGVPVGVKDIFRVDGFQTRAGSKLPAELFGGNEAESVTRLKEAGALILGKTVTTEFAYFAPGPTTNPFHEDHTPGGSSSGSAAAVSAGMCPLALGTQTIGSINRPAAFCGVVGFKPSYNRISKKGVIPVSTSLDHVGCFTGNARGAAWAASVLIPDWKQSSPGDLPTLGVPEGPYLEKALPEGMEHFHRTAERLAEMGYKVVRTEVMPDFDQIVARHQIIMAAEVARVHSEWFAKYRSRYHEKTAALIQQGQSISEATLQETLPGRIQLRNELMTAMEESGLDLWVAPAAKGTAPQGLQSTGDPVMNLPWTHSGLPSVSLPSGFNSSGLPFGLQVIGKWYGDEVLLAWASGIESSIGGQEDRNELHGL
jgi:Asp-tRNA(Asn)/Glu-tRNA(Gln) amidotransferase A subunit family amidase